MKKTALILLALSIGLIASAQTSFESYLKRVPALPKDSCNISKASAENFVRQVTDLIEELSNDIEERKQRVDDYAEEKEGDMQANAMKMMQQKYGMSEEDLKKFKNSEEMTEDETQAMADKIMKQQTNMSMDEIQNMSKMSEAGKKAYAEAYAAEAMANVQSDPEKDVPDKTAGNLYNLTNEQQTLNQKIVAGQQKIATMYAAIENDPERQKMLDRMDAWQNKVMSMTGVDYGQGKQMDSLALLIKNEKIAYCNKYTPKYRAALRKHLVILKTSLPDYQSSGNIMAEVTKAQTGIVMPAEGTEIPALQAIDQYLKALQGAYKYKLYFPEDDN